MYIWCKNYVDLSIPRGGKSLVKKVLKKSKIKSNDVDEVIMGQVLTGSAGQNPARQAAIQAGLPIDKTAYVINQVCGSGLRSVAAGYQAIMSKDANIVVAGGQENMSNAPHAIHIRNGQKLDKSKLVDTMIKDGLWDAFNGYHMGITAENVASKWQITRKDQDDFALSSQTKTEKAQKDGKFKNENELLKYTKGKLKENKRQIRKNSAKAFSLVVDCSVMEKWNESDYVEYLKEANKWLNDYFSKKYGLINLGSIIHMDESKPHLHIAFSYFSEIEGAWIQKQLYKDKVTNFNILLKKFEQEVGAKFGLKKGDNKNIKKQLNINAAEIFNTNIQTYKVKTGLLSTQEIKAISVKNINKCLTIYNNKIIKKVPSIGELERLKEELIKKNKEVEEIKKEAKEEAKEELEQQYQQEIKELVQQLQEQEEAINEVKLLLKQKNNLLKEKEEEYTTHLQDIQNRLKNRIGLTDKQIKDITKFDRDYFKKQNQKDQTKTTDKDYSINIGI